MRRAALPAGRRFTKAAQRALVAALMPLGSVRVFYGENETLAETVRLFQDARVVVGYHGAGFGERAVPAGRAGLRRRDRRGVRRRPPWRTNEELVRFNAGLTWRTVRLGLAEVLAANDNARRPAEERYPLVKGVRDPDRWLKTVARVDLNATDVARVAAAAAACGGLPRWSTPIGVRVSGGSWVSGSTPAPGMDDVLTIARKRGRKWLRVGIELGVYVPVCPRGARRWTSGLRHRRAPYVVLEVGVPTTAGRRLCARCMRLGAAIVVRGLVNVGAFIYQQPPATRASRPAFRVIERSSANSRAASTRAMRAKRPRGA